MKIVNENNLKFFRSRPCDFCQHPPPSQAAHYFTRGMGGGQRLDVRQNLCSLCVLCHARHHNGHPPTQNHLAEIIAHREQTTAQAIQAYLWQLQRTLDGDATPPTFSEFCRTAGFPCPDDPPDAVFTDPPPT